MPNITNSTDAADIKQIKYLLDKYRKAPKKSLGQNFLINPEIPKKTAALSLNGQTGQSCGVIEIGPGIGALTGELCRLYAKAAAIEIDRAFEPILKETCGGFDNLKIIFGDILKTDLRGIAEKELAGTDKINICANLPYYITTPVILKLLGSGVKFNCITVMIQKEAADKLCAKAGEDNYGASSAIIGYYGEAKKMFTVPKSSFYPPPKVLSAVVRIAPYDTPTVKPKSENRMFKVIEAAFGQRRKTLVNALVSGLNLEKERAADIIKKVTGDERVRGEELDIRAFSDISDLIENI